MLEIVRGVADEPELQGGELPFVESGLCTGRNCSVVTFSLTSYENL